MTAENLKKLEEKGDKKKRYKTKPVWAMTKEVNNYIIQLGRRKTYKRLRRWIIKLCRKFRLWWIC